MIITQWCLPPQNSHMRHNVGLLPNPASPTLFSLVPLEPRGQCEGVKGNVHGKGITKCIIQLLSLQWNTTVYFWRKEVYLSHGSGGWKSTEHGAGLLRLALAVWPSGGDKMGRPHMGVRKRWHLDLGVEMQCGWACLFYNSLRRIQGVSLENYTPPMA